MAGPQNKCHNVIGPMPGVLNKDDIDSRYQHQTSNSDSHSEESDSEDSDSQDGSSYDEDSDMSENENAQGEDHSSSQSTNKHGRGPTRISKDWGTKKKMHLRYNEYNQVVGLNSDKLSSQLGNIAKDGNRLPLTYTDWRAMPAANKDRVWLDIKANTNLDERCKRICLKRINKLWKDWKAEIKAAHYTPYKRDKERLRNCPDPRIEEDQWPILVNYWGTKKAKMRSKLNKKNRKKQKMLHRTGRRGFPNVREDFRAQHGKSPSKVEMFIVTRQKNGEATDEEAAVAIKKLTDLTDQLPESSRSDNGEKDKIFDHVMGPEKPGCVRTYGLGPTPSEVYGPFVRQPTRDMKAFEDEVNARVANLLGEMRERMNAEWEEKLSSVKQECMKECMLELQKMQSQMGVCYNNATVASNAPVVNASKVPASSSSHRAHSHQPSVGDKNSSQANEHGFQSQEASHDFKKKRHKKKLHKKNDTSQR